MRMGIGMGMGMHMHMHTGIVYARRSHEPEVPRIGLPYLGTAMA